MLGKKELELDRWDSLFPPQPVDIFLESHNLKEEKASLQEKRHKLPPLSLPLVKGGMFPQPSYTGNLSPSEKREVGVVN